MSEIFRFYYQLSCYSTIYFCSQKWAVVLVVINGGSQAAKELVIVDEALWKTFSFLLH